MRWLCFGPLALVACTSTDTPEEPKVGSTCGVSIAPVVSDGHSDPGGAKAAKRARAGRITDAKLIRQPIDARQKARIGDFLIANEKIAAVIEDMGLSDGYARFGGEILAVDRVGDDGLMLGQSTYGETLAGFAGEMIHPESVGVLADGSDGQAAIVRVVGTLEPVPFLVTFKSALPQVGFRAALDYVLEPGSEVLRMRFTLLNESEDDRTLLALGGPMHGFFHSARNTLFTPEKGFATPHDSSWVGWENDGTSFAWRIPGAPIEYNLNVSGFQFFTGPLVDIPRCQLTDVPFAEVIVGGPGLDGLREAVRRVDKAPAWRALSGTVKSALGTPLAGALVSAIAADGKLVTRGKSGAAGKFVVHVPNEVVSLLATVRGIPSNAPLSVPVATTSADLVLAAHGTITVHATEKGTATKLPVRIQVIPEMAMAPTPAALGILDEAHGRLHQEMAVSGDAVLSVPPGKHRVIVSHGYEWELLDTTVDVTAGMDTPVGAELAHSVDSTGYMCADFHIHSFFSADSNDPVVHKVKSAVADGLDIPVSSEHEWVVDFQPVIADLGLQKWAFGVPSEELTTFLWGHFGVVPLQPKPTALNHGAIEWVGKEPPEVFADVAAQPEKPVLIINHPRSAGFGGYFEAAGYDPKTLHGEDPLWSDQFEAIECFNDSDFTANRDKVVKDWYSMLDAGKKRVCVGSSDSHHLRDSPVGYPRTCMYFGHDDTTKLSAVAVRDALRSGRATVSGGIYLTVAGPKGEGPGQVAPSGNSFEITAAAPSWVDVDPNVEVIVDGATVATMPLTPEVIAVGKRLRATVTIDRTNKKWVVFHVKGKGDLAPLHPGRKAFAFSNPIFLQ
jgi:hypothetical protein